MNNGTTSPPLFLDTATNYYVDSSLANTGTILTWNVAGQGNLNPILYFKYIKSKFNLLQQKQINNRLQELEDAFYVAVENGQKVLAEKFLADLDMYAKEAMAMARGLKYWILVDDVNKHKHNIKGGHISDTAYENYTRVIPKRVVKEKEKYNGIFDSFVIYHYYNENQPDLKKLTPDEKQKMKDPVLFGRINNSNRLYFIADWEDDYCDLTFNEMIKVLGKEKRQKINQKIKLGDKNK